MFMLLQNRLYQTSLLSLINCNSAGTLRPSANWPIAYFRDKINLLSLRCCGRNGISLSVISFVSFNCKYDDNGPVGVTVAADVEGTALPECEGELIRLMSPKASFKAL